MPGWREEVKKQASFGGIPFTVDAASIKFGRKLEEKSADGGGLFSVASFMEGSKEEKELSQKRPGYVDNGILGREVTLTANFSGEFYNLIRDQFIAAVEDGTPKKLVLPTYAVMQNMKAEIGTVTFDNRKGGYESVTVRFFTQGEVTSPAEVPATKADVKGSASQSNESGATNFIQNQSVPTNEFSFDQVVDDVQNFIDSALEWLSSGPAASDDAYDDAAKALNEIADNKETLAADPAEMNNAYFDALDSLSAAFTDAESAFAAQLGIASTYAGKIQAVTGIGAAAVERQRNRVSQLVMIQNYCISNAASILSLLDFAVVEDAATVRATFTAAVRSLQDTIGTYGGYPETYRDLIRLNASVFNDLVQRSAALPVLESRDVLSDTGGARYAYQKYGDADRITEILQRNDVRRSLFVSGTLELLSR